MEGRAGKRVRAGCVSGSLCGFGVGVDRFDDVGVSVGVGVSVSVLNGFCGGLNVGFGVDFGDEDEGYFLIDWVGRQ